jgi:hypothetical protein
MVYATTAALLAFQSVLIYLDKYGLAVVHEQLKAADIVRVCAEGELAELRADVLDATCCALVAAGVGSIEYFVGTGDAFPRVPDFVSEA